MVYYIISNSHGYYIRKDEFSNKYVPVRNIKFAERWSQRAKAANVLKNALSKNIRDSYKITEIIEEGVTTEKNKTSVPTDCEQCSDNQIDKWSSGIDGMAEFVLDAEHRKEELNQKLSDVDREITDINHYIEFGKFNAFQGWLAFDMLRKRLQKRRKIKDEMYVIQQLGDCKISSSMLLGIKSVISEMSNRQYTPRALPDLFE